MSRRKIRKGPRKKKPKGIDTSPGRALRAILEQKREKRRMTEIRDLAKLMAKNKTLRIDEIADLLGWKESKVRKVIERIQENEKRVRKEKEARKLNG